MVIAGVGAVVLLAGLAASWRWGLRARLDRAARGEGPDRPDVAERARIAREIGRQVDAGRDAGYRAASNLPPSL